MKLTVRKRMNSVRPSSDGKHNRHVLCNLAVVLQYGEDVAAPKTHIDKELYRDVAEKRKTAYVGKCGCMVFSQGVHVVNEKLNRGKKYYGHLVVEQFDAEAMFIQSRLIRFDAHIMPENIDRTDTAFAFAVHEECHIVVLEKTGEMGGYWLESRK